jgi:hypothetical protein
MRKPLKHALFWITFAAVYFDVCRTWSDLLGHFALGHHGLVDIVNTVVIVFVTLHLWAGGGDHA